MKPFVNIILHRPNSKEKEEILNARVAKIYGITVQNTIEKLNCSKEQKLKLLDEVLLVKEKTF